MDIKKKIVIAVAVVIVLALASAAIIYSSTNAKADNAYTSPIAILKVE